MMICHQKRSRSFSDEQANLRKDRVDARMHDAREPWTMRTAFHAISGTCVYRSRYATGKTMVTLDMSTLQLLASREPETLLPVKIAATQNPGQSSVVVKIVTCVQAAWFCSQCIARIRSGMAISLLELNTFAHCVSAFFIYGFWWHKPYDVTSHNFVQSKMLDFLFLRYATVDASWHPFCRRTAVDLLAYNHGGDQVHITMIKCIPRYRFPQHYGEEHYLEITEGDLIPGTGFFFWRSNHPRTSKLIFVLSKVQIARLERLWCFTNESPDGIATPKYAGASCDLRPGGRIENIRVYSDELISAIIPLDGPASLKDSLSTAASVNFAFVLYGGLHLLAWQYHFRSTTEAILWKIAGVLATSSGVVPLLLLLPVIALQSIRLVPRSLSPKLDELMD
jgi:hypothetical protein